MALLFKALIFFPLKPPLEPLDLPAVAVGSNLIGKVDTSGKAKLCFSSCLYCKNLEDLLVDASAAEEEEQGEDGSLSSIKWSE
ncbi:hypothetical protein WICPIJ_007217 [Wickerhamomyces pijperi]|uniref:Uncharacterized protein n=1 Tax=Wickerhamomyces pijperi TaxID=599730 RepID=A0A9P8Q2Y0_WICPI|nr:hypothetical protein WICPIJ_007217 [Wickerhamomyces pijperi]